MPQPRSPARLGTIAATAAIATAAFALACAAVPAHAAGLDIHADAELSDIGLPGYPGAIKVPDKDLDSPGFSFGVWFGSVGVHLHVLNFHSADDADTVAAFYLRAMSTYGTVLDCSGNQRTAAPAAASAASSARKSSEMQPVACEDDTVKSGGHLYKVGRKGDFREVRIEPRHSGVHLELLRLETHGTD